MLDYFRGSKSEDKIIIIIYFKITVDKSKNCACCYNMISLKEESLILKMMILHLVMIYINMVSMKE